MASKKINWWEARSVGLKVAERAFEHLLSPLEKALDGEALKVYNQVMVRCGLDDEPRVAEMAAAGIVTKSSLCEIRVESEESFFSHTLWSVEKNAPETFVTQRVTVLTTGEVSTKALLAAMDAAKPLKKAREAFAERIRLDVEGKTTTFVVKTWPEIAGIMYETIGGAPSKPLEVPFESLIRQYMSPFLSLPAPAETV